MPVMSDLDERRSSGSDRGPWRVSPWVHREERRLYRPLKGDEMLPDHQDYDEVHTVGDLANQTVDEILSGDEMARLRRLAYGIDDAPEDFICRNCLFALTD